MIIKKNSYPYVRHEENNSFRITARIRNLLMKIEIKFKTQNYGKRRNRNRLKNVKFYPVEATVKISLFL